MDEQVQSKGELKAEIECLKTRLVQAQWETDKAMVNWKSELATWKHRADVREQEYSRVIHSLDQERSKFNGYQMAVRDVVSNLPRPDPCGGC